jgi:hypothetical protein
MEEEIRDLVFNLMCDLKKKDIQPIAKAKLIRTYLTDINLTERQLALRLGMPHSTLQDWLRWEKTGNEEYKKLREEGYSHLDIYNSLRSGVLSGKKKAIDVALQNCISKLEIFKIKPPFSKDTKQLLGKLKYVVSVIERQVE